MANGKWGLSGFPTYAWKHADFFDNGEVKTTICEVCEVQELRYRYLVVHPVFPKGLWAGVECANKLCAEEAEHLQRIEAQKIAEAQDKADRSVAVNGINYLTCPPALALPKWSPLMLPTAYGTGHLFSILPWPQKTVVHFSGTWPNWIVGGPEVATLYPVAWCVDALVAKGWSPCYFGAMLLRDADRQALKQLAPNKVVDYLFSMEVRCGASGSPERVIWTQEGPARWQSSYSYLFDRSLKYTAEDGRWDLTKVMYPTSEPDADPIMYLAFGEEW